MERWGSERASELADIAAVTMPDEALTADELLACCWEGGGPADDPVVVLSVDDGAGAVAVVCRRMGDRRVAGVSLLAVLPAAQGQGRGRALLDAARDWAFDEAAAGALVLGGLAPFYLWPGVDVRRTRALVLAESAGYRPRGAELNMSCPTSFRRRPPAGVAIRRVLDEADAGAAAAFCRAERPGWVAEVQRGIEHGSCLVAIDEATGDVVGLGCHSVNRAGWVGPMLTDPRHRGGGVGAALLAGLCTDLSTAGFTTAEISWVGPLGFYARTAGAEVSRVFRTMTLAG